MRYFPYSGYSLKKSFFISLFFFFATGYAQLTEQLFYPLSAVSDTLVFHTEPVNPSYFSLSTLSGKSVPGSLFTVDFPAATLYFSPGWKTHYDHSDTLAVSFRRYPRFLTRDYFVHDTTAIYPSALLGKPAPLPRIFDEKKPWQGLNTQGTISRGLTIGNRRDPLLDSEMDLRITGRLSSQVSLKARINDTNIPLQENGYSQELKDIDRVYIEMAGPYWNLTAGDMMMRNDSTVFLNFTKKISGLSLAYDSGGFSAGASAAKVRGRFTEYSFRARDGIQGPYKLKGGQGENYIFIIAGSERVYLNGKLLQRGENKDYIIDYQTAEITFNPSFPLSAGMRIVVRYQYSDRHYARFISFDRATFSSGKWHSSLYFYTEQDLKTQSLQMDLTPQQIEQLAQSPPSGGPVYLEQAVETPYSANLILYRRTPQGYFEYSTDPGETLYSVGFTQFSPGEGDYTVASYEATGKIMQYVGEGQGDYRAVVPVTPPSRSQLWVWKNTWSPGIHSRISSEIAYTQNSTNLFSPSGNAKGNAPAFHTGWHEILLDSTGGKSFLQSRLFFDYRHENFKTPENIDPVDFIRDWNISATGTSRYTAGAELNWISRPGFTIDYYFEHLGFLHLYSGYKNALKTSWNRGGWSFSHTTSLVSSRDTIRRGSFFRSNGSAGFQGKKIFTGARYDVENNVLKDLPGNFKLPGSFRFSQMSLWLGTGDTTRTYLKADFSFDRTDSVRTANFENRRLSRTFRLSARLFNSGHSGLNINAYYRLLILKDSLPPGMAGGNLSYHHTFGNGWLQIRTAYENFSGTVPRQEYTYVQTEPGHGYYTWIDYNADGNPDPDEFEIAVYSDQADYLRVALPNTRYLPTRKAGVQTLLSLKPDRLDRKTVLYKFFSPFSAHFSMKVQNDRTLNPAYFHWNPFRRDTRDLVTGSATAETRIDWQPAGKKYRLSYTYRETRRDGIDIFGSQSSGLYAHFFEIRYRLFPGFYALANAGKDNVFQSHDVFYRKNYRILSGAFAPGIDFIPDKKHKLTTSFQWKTMQNTLAGQESNLQRTLNIAYFFTPGSGQDFLFDVVYSANAFSGNPFSPAGYYMLNGLQPGKNLTWNISWTRKINTFLHLHLIYNARTSFDHRTAVHNGTVKLTAGF